ncbi:MAG TPA: hypothetical protein VHW09_13370 [Bryobacteraceae bacterium]|jgi:hypothetical protein|nr:hypothetical protein [Bryobacteraceae bacterium]
MISLRLSAEEYQTLHRLYPTYGARNVSDFARLALQRVIGHPIPSANDPAAKVQELDERLSALEEKVALLLEHELEKALV